MEENRIKLCPGCKNLTKTLESKEVIEGSPHIVTLMCE